MKTIQYKKHYLFLSILVLLLTTFSVVQGWLVTGDFIPRFLFILTSAIFFTQLFSSKTILWLLIYFCYILISDPSFDIVLQAAQFMEFAIPILIATFIFSEKNTIWARRMAFFCFIITIVTILLTIFVNFTHPGIVREMVAFSYKNELEAGITFKRMGVCNYSFALIIMCIIPALMFLYKKSNTKRNRLFFLLFAIIVFYFIYISEITTCLIISLFTILLSIVHIITNSKHFILQSIVVGVIILAFGFTLADFAAPWFEGTAFETHIDGLAEFYGIRRASAGAYDFEERVNLYKLSLDTFQNNLFLGDATAPNGGHNYFLDRLAKYGLIGTMPLFVFIYYSCRLAYYYIPKQSRNIYLICIIAFLALGFLKNMSGIDFWSYMFLYIPCILKLTEEPSFK